jgi:hypothetical protein
MSAPASGYASQAPYAAGDNRERYGYGPPQWYRPTGGISGWTVAGLAVLGLGALAFMYFAPDLRRYMKIERM